MKMCEKHWLSLRTKLKEKGLEDYISKDGKLLANRLKKELNKEYTIEDPLFAANMAIVNNALQHGGPYLLTKDPEGNPYCPLCEVLKGLGDEMDKTWLEYASEEQRVKFEKAGLLNKN